VILLNKNLDLVLPIQKLVEDCCQIKEDENVLILGTIETNRDLLDSIMDVSIATKAKATMIITKSWPRGAEPWKPIAEAMKSADVLINFAPLFDQQAVKEALDAGLRIAVVNRNIDYLKRGLDIDYNEIAALHERIANVLRKGKIMRVTSEAGTDVTMDITGRTIMRGDGILREPGEMQWLPGSQLNQAAIEESVNGMLVFDWDISSIGHIKNSVNLTIKNGRIVKFEGGEEAEAFKKYIESLNDPRMYWVCHYTFGLNPALKMNPDNHSESERVRGSIVFGFGSQLPGYKGKLGVAAAHIDCIMKSPTVYVDSKMILKDYKFLI